MQDMLEVLIRAHYAARLFETVRKASPTLCKHKHIMK